MKNFFSRLIDAIAAWLFTPPKAKPTYSCCSDRAKDEKEEEKEKRKPHMQENYWVLPLSSN